VRGERKRKRVYMHDSYIGGGALGLHGDPRCVVGRSGVLRPQCASRWTRREWRRAMMISSYVATRRAGAG
jgi:hypothetical protein